MIKTKYTIKQEGSSYIALKGSKVQSHTFTEMDSLQSVWVLENYSKQQYLHLVNGFVYLEEIEDEQL